MRSSQSNPGRKPSKKPKASHTRVSCPHANDPVPPQPPVDIALGAPKAENVVRGDGEALLMGAIERRRQRVKNAPRRSARSVCYQTRPGRDGNKQAGELLEFPNLVPIPDPSQDPYRWVCLLEIFPRSGNTVLLGSGWLVTANTVITAGHCVFPGDWASYIRVHLAVNGSQENYSVQESHSLHSVAQWTQEGKEAYDYGAILLPAPFDGGDGPPGHFGYASLSDGDLQSLKVTLLGYPKDVPVLGTMWGDQGFLANISPTQIFYDLESIEGMSGGPVFFTEGDTRRVVGIHNYGDGGLGNHATRVTDPVYSDIQAWANGDFSDSSRS